MKKHFLALLIAMAIVFAVPAGTSAEGSYLELNASDLKVSLYGDSLAYKAVNDRFYQLIDTKGNPITDAVYISMYPDSSWPFFKVEAVSDDGVHDEGLIDLQGNVIVPAQYADIDVISDRWASGVKLTPSSADDKDYTFSNWSTGEKTFYRIDTVDFYYRGALVGTLNRSEYGSSYAEAFGDYIRVTTRENKRVFYNSRMEKSPVDDAYGEYTQNYSGGKTTFIHNGSGQAAFCAGCTLTKDEVKQYLAEDGQGNVIDLQGNVVFSYDRNLDYLRGFAGGYAEFKRGDVYGLIDEKGNEVIPAEYDDIGNYEEQPFAFGCISAVKDGKFGFLDANGNVTSDFVYAENIVENRTTFASIQNLDGTIIVLSGLVGELPEHYAEVRMTYSGARAFTAKNASGESALIGLDGQTLIPYTECYDISYNRDATVALADMRNRTYRIYTFDSAAAPAGPGASEDGAPAQDNPAVPDDGGAGEEIPEETVSDAAGAIAEDGSWTCSNGHDGNMGNFCAWCGEPKPVEEAPITACPNCGQAFEDGNVPNFCPNCGNKIQ